MAHTLHKPKPLETWLWPNHYIPTVLDGSISLDFLVSAHYFEYSSSFPFQGESHDFWKLLFVDKGTIEVTAEDQAHMLKKGDIIFHKPRKFHILCANGVTAPNLVVVSFDALPPRSISLPIRFFIYRIQSARCLRGWYRSQGQPFLARLISRCFS